MKKLIMRICGLVGAVMFFINCSERKPVAYNSLVHEYGNILDIAYTPNDSAFGRGWFSDQGSWMGFTLPEKEQWINGFWTIRLGEPSLDFQIALDSGTDGISGCGLPCRLGELFSGGIIYAFINGKRSDHSTVDFYRPV